jgi:hypothetical protein
VITNVDRMTQRFAGLRARCSAPGTRDGHARKELLDFAGECGAFEPELAEGALEVLSADSSRGVRTSAAGGLRRLLQELGGLSRTLIVAEWTCSDHPGQRGAVARALCSRIPVLGTTAALECLSRDSDAHTRRSACQAAICRFTSDPRAMTAVLRGCAHDVDPSVREVALAGLERVAALDVALRCVACGSVDFVEPQDSLGDWGFCRQCLEGARSAVAVEELGGEG